jgi:hypothetical protein
MSRRGRPKPQNSDFSNCVAVLGVAVYNFVMLFVWVEDSGGEFLSASIVWAILYGILGSIFGLRGTVVCNALAMLCVSSVGNTVLLVVGMSFYFLFICYLIVALIYGNIVFDELNKGQ